MQEIFLAFILSFFFSFIGSIPPGTINLTVLQLGLEHKTNIAWRLSMAAALVEYPYAWLAIKFETLITSSPVIVENFHLITAIVMIVLGIMNLLPTRNPSGISQKFQSSGFRRGLLLGILNPLALPYWIGITAYLKGQGWLVLSTNFQLHAYLVGVSLGALALLLTLIYLGKRIASGFQQNVWLKKIPGMVLLGLGVYALIQYAIRIL
ncbi:MAG TPA: LysE family transporter [Ohtaekwangia sp.]